MSRFLLLNFEDFGLNQDITKSIQSHTPFCICCLQTNVPLINLLNCKHSTFLDIYFKPEPNRHNHVVCQQCHSVLIKIKQFEEQVENSLHKLQNESFNIAEQKVKRRLNIHKTVDILLSPANVNMTVALNETKTKSALENAETPSNKDTDVKSTKKLKNIQKALEIINNNRSDDSLAVLNMGLQCLKASNLGNIICKPLDVLKEPKDCGQSSPQYDDEFEEISIKVENVEFDNIDNETASTSVQTEETTEEAVVKRGHRDNATQRCLYIKTVTLSKEELMKERYLKTQSLDYLKHQYKCDHCIIGFNYKDNLEHHMQRKHSPKLDSVTCDLCLQVLHPIGSFYAHNFNHYTRYECVSCKKRFPEYGDALKHYRNQHGFRKIESRCRFCNFSVDSRSKLKSHIQKYHNKFPCEVCGMPHASLTSRKWHKMVKHEKKCTQCELHFTTSNEFCKHMKRYHAYCAECDVRFKSWYACIAHMRFSVAHADKRKRYKCDDCGMRFLMENQRNQHMIMKHKKTQHQ